MPRPRDGWLRLGSVWILVCEECMVETAVQAPETKGPKGGKRGGKGKGGKRGGKGQGQGSIVRLRVVF